MAKFGQPGAPARGPGGRPKAVKAVEEIARQHTSVAMETLVEICGDKGQPAAARVSAASTLLDRGWGKARQEHQLHVSVDPTSLSDDDLAAIAAGNIAAAAAADDSADTMH